MPTKTKGRYETQASPNKQKSKKERSTGAKILYILKNIFVWLVAIAAVAMMIFTIISVTTFDRNERSLFGYQMFIVRTDSMKATDFDSGDLILTKRVDPATLQEGDIIAFRSTNPENFGEVVTHKIRSLTTTQDGEPAFITYGTTTNTDDATPVTYEYVLGKYEGYLPKVGTFFTFLKTTPGYICCILLPFMLLIIMQGVNSIQVFRQYQQEKKAEIQVERDQLAAEREETRRMMEELTQMQAQMVQNASSTAMPSETYGENGNSADSHTADRQQGFCLPDTNNQEEKYGE